MGLGAADVDGGSFTAHGRFTGILGQPTTPGPPYGRRVTETRVRADLALIALIVAVAVGAVVFSFARPQDPPASSWPVVCRVVQPEDLP